VYGGHGAASRGWRRWPKNGRPVDRETETDRGTAADGPQNRPAVPQRDTRVPERRTVFVGIPAGWGPRARVARVRVRSQRVRRPLAR